MATSNWREREALIRQQIDDELIVFDQHTCKVISIKRDTRALASISTRKIVVANARTITMQTEVEAR